MDELPKVSERVLQRAAVGIPAINLGVPTRYGHSQSGVIDRAVRVAALNFSAQAADKITGANGTCMTIEELLNDNPKGSRVRILR